MVAVFILASTVYPCPHRFWRSYIWQGKGFG